LTRPSLRRGPGASPASDFSRVEDDGTTSKLCATCNIFKPLDQFYRQEACFLGAKPDCIACYNQKQRENQAYLRPYWRAAVLRRYNLTTEQYDALLERQGNCCALCKSPNPGGKGAWHIDHNHSCCSGRTSCGKCVRGLLCNGCNLGMGHLEKTLQAVGLDALVQYVNSAATKQHNAQEATK
jgi:hypothetical protein